MLAQNKLIASLLVMAGFVAWLASGTIFGVGWARYIIGSAAFFIVACFLPETRRTTFLSRRSSLGLVGLFAWMAASQILSLYPIDSTVFENPMLLATIDVGSPLLLGFLAYWLSVFLIRGFRASPEYDINQGEQDETQQPPPAALSSTSPVV